MEELVADKEYHRMADGIFYNLVRKGCKIGDQDPTTQKATELGLSIIDAFRVERGDTLLERILPGELLKKSQEKKLAST
ncbi:MAG: hypothetical protein V1921_01220 [Candidatus Altiarchaeota archaeon]